MPRLSIEDLKRIRDGRRQAITLRSGVAPVRITVHLGACGISAGARDVMAALLKEIERQQSVDMIVLTSGCAGHCSREPMATVELAGQSPVIYAGLNPDRMLTVLGEHVLGGKIVTEFAIDD